MASGASTDRFDVIVSTTLREYQPKLVDNVTKKILLFSWLKSKDRMRVLDGGEEIIVPLLYAFNDTVKSYSAYEQLDLIPQTGIGNARYEWKQTAGSVTISGKEMRQNSGDKQVINLLKAKVNQLEISFADWFNTKLFADGTGNANKDIDGIPLFITSAGTGTVGGINSSTYTWWKNYTVAGTQSAAAFDNLLARMRTAYNTISKGVDFPDIGITDQTVFEGYESKLVATLNYNVALVDTKTGDLGFQNLKFKGMTLGWDDYCTAGAMYLINSNYLEMFTHKDANFSMQDFIKPDNQDAKSALMLWMGNLTCSNRAKQGIIHTIT